MSCSYMLDLIEKRFEVSRIVAPTQWCIEWGKDFMVEEGG